MLLRYFWEDWMEKKDYGMYPTLEDYIADHIEAEFETSDIQEAQERCLSKVLQNHIPFDEKRFGPYPAMLKPFVNSPKYQLKYKNDEIVGRDENLNHFSL